MERVHGPVDRPQRRAQRLRNDQAAIEARPLAALGGGAEAIGARFLEIEDAGDGPGQTAAGSSVATLAALSPRARSMLPRSPGAICSRAFARIL